MKNIVTICFFALFSQIAYSQLLSDAVRYTRHNLSGTAASIAVGGGVSALGADYAALSVNPAGLGVYRKSLTVFSLGYGALNSIADFTNNSTGRSSYSDAFGNLSLTNAGYVSVNRPIGKKWKTSNWTIGINRLADFNQDIQWQGVNDGSIADRFLQTAVDFGISDPWGDALADETGLIFTAEDDQGTYLTNDVPPGTLLAKRQTIRRRGAIHELMVGFGGNYAEKFYLGLSLGFPFVNFEEEKNYFEDDGNGDIPIYESVSFDESVNTTGSGINAKLGLIYKPFNALRLGLSVHTPTQYILTDQFTADLQYVASDLSDPANPFTGGTARSPQGESEYNFRTPWRFVTGAGWIIGRIGFLSADLEYVNYASTSFDLNIAGNDPANQAFEDQLNRQIDEQLAETFNLRFGGEIVLNPFRLRGGYAILGPSLNNGTAQQFLSAGIGFTKGRFFLDIAARQLVGQEQYQPYTTSYSDAPQINIQKEGIRGFITVGFR